MKLWNWLKQYTLKSAAAKLAVVVLVLGLSGGAITVMNAPHAQPASVVTHTATKTAAATPASGQAATTPTSAVATPSATTTQPATAATKPAQTSTPSPVTKPYDNSTALPVATVTPLPVRHPGDGPAANYGTVVTKTGPKSISWTSPYTATGYYIMFMNQNCSPTIDPIVPCDSYFTVPGTTGGSYTFTYGDGGTYGVTAVVDVCVNQDVAYCGAYGSNTVSLDF